ncbi:hypothetical protein TNCV_1189111 [Trichonephila clavipes]|nr:hypothetical protein TNCV_1189111 [Trichonephila clavipes]
MLPITSQGPNRLAGFMLSGFLLGEINGTAFALASRFRSSFWIIPNHSLLLCSDCLFLCCARRDCQHCHGRTFVAVSPLRVKGAVSASTMCVIFCTDAYTCLRHPVKISCRRRVSD